MTSFALSLTDSESSSARKKLAISAGFNKHASQYDKHAQVQQIIAKQALDIFSSLAIKPGCTLDLGCGTGAYLNRLHAYSHTLVGLDISKNMLLQARQNWQHTAQQHVTKQTHNTYFVNADAESLPMPSSSIDAVFSSMALQWCISPQTLLSELHRVIKPGGHAVLAILVDGSFEQLHQAYHTLGIASRLNRFASTKNWLDSCSKHDWHYQYSEHIFNTTHGSLIDMLHSIKRVGAAAKTHVDMPVSQAKNTDCTRVLLPSKSTTTKSQSTTKNSPFISRNEIKKISDILIGQNNNNTTLPLAYKVLFLTISK